MTQTSSGGILSVYGIRHATKSALRLAVASFRDDLRLTNDLFTLLYKITLLNKTVLFVHEGHMRRTRAARLQDASRQRRDQQKQELRQAILDAAGALFLEHGYEHFSLRQVAERIGYSATTIYLYFADKDDLLFTVADHGFARFGQCLTDAAASPGDPLQRLRALPQAYLQFGLYNPAYYQLMFMQRGDFLVGYRQGDRQPRIDTLRIVQDAIQHAMDAGMVRPGNAQHYADALWAAMHGVVALTISMPAFSVERAEVTAEILLNLVFESMIQS